MDRSPNPPMRKGTEWNVHRAPDGCRRFHPQATDGRTMDGSRARALLGVSAHATPEELRRAFRRAALSTHPDRGGDATRFDETVSAFRSLSASAALTAVPAAASDMHVPFDAYDSVSGSSARPARPSFAEVLERITVRSRAAA